MAMAITLEADPCKQFWKYIEANLVLQFAIEFVSQAV